MPLHVVPSPTGLPSKRCPGHRVLIKSGPENRGRSARGTSHVASLEFPPETGLILIATGELIPLLCLEGVPGLPGAPQDEAGLRRKFETSHV